MEIKPDGTVVYTEQERRVLDEQLAFAKMGQPTHIPYLRKWGFITEKEVRGE